MATVIQTADVQVQTGLALLKDMFRGYTPRDCAIRFWDGTTWDPEPNQEAHFTLVLNHPGALRSMFWPPCTHSMGQAFLYDDFNIEGDILAFTVFCDYLANLKPTLSLFQRLSLGWRLWNLPTDKRPRTGLQIAQLRGQLHSRQRDREAISYHYDLSNEFFEQILDSRMQYTCANFADPSEDLETAQLRKLDLICRKLRLKPGERLLDIGCGWGGLVMFAAKNYGVEALGVTLSARQVEWAQKQIRAAGLENRCRVDLMDYRDVDEGTTFDKIATIEMTEHLGSSQFPTYFQKCWRLLRPHGSLLIQQITQADLSGMPRAKEFSDMFVFPDGELVSVTFTQREAEKAGFEVRDVEGRREHYALTLRRWLDHVESRHDALVRATDEATYRVFRLYFAGARLGMQINVYGLHQILFVKPDRGTSGYPLSRQDWYGNVKSGA